MPNSKVTKPLWVVILLAVIVLGGKLAGVWEALIDWARAGNQQEYYQLQRIDEEKTSRVNEDASFTAVVNQTNTTEAINYKWYLQKPSSDFEKLPDNNSFISIELPCSTFKPGIYTIKVNTSLKDGSNQQDKSMQFSVQPYSKEYNSISGWNINDPCAQVNLPRKVILSGFDLNIVASQLLAHSDGTQIVSMSDMTYPANRGSNGKPGKTYNKQAGRGNHGSNAGHGTKGNDGLNGANSANATIIVDEMIGKFQFDLRGQDGGVGGSGGKGGKGQNGGDGNHGVDGFLDCRSGPQSGRNGGIGGNGGYGGIGGVGGNAGNIVIETSRFNSDTTINSMLSGGQGGKGGKGGQKGLGGSGGARGSAPGKCSSGGRGNGSGGSEGENGLDHTNNKSNNGKPGNCTITDQSGTVKSCAVAQT
jgi:hypothetical protein